MNENQLSGAIEAETTSEPTLDVADRGGTTLEDVGAIMNLTRERIRQVEVKALAKLEALSDMYSLRDHVDEGPVGKRRLPQLSKDELSGKGKSKVVAKVVAKAVPVVIEIDDEDEDEDDFD